MDVSRLTLVLTSATAFCLSLANFAPHSRRALALIEKEHVLSHWQYYDRIEYGWPTSFVYVFAKPDAYTGSWMLDTLPLGLSAACWLILIFVSLTPHLISVWKYNRNVEKNLLIHRLKLRI